MLFRWPGIGHKLALAIAVAAPAFSQDALVLWYNQPANLWVEALPWFSAG
jgi:hypothetical protein